MTKQYEVTVTVLVMADDVSDVMRTIGQRLGNYCTDTFRMMELPTCFIEEVTMRRKES